MKAVPACFPDPLASSSGLAGPPSSHKLARRRLVVDGRRVSLVRRAGTSGRGPGRGAPRLLARRGRRVAPARRPASSMLWRAAPAGRVHLALAGAPAPRAAALAASICQFSSSLSESESR